MRTFAQARKDLERYMRSGESILAECKTEDVEPPELILGGGTAKAYIFLTNARLAWMSANHDGIVAVRWKNVTSMDFGKKRFKQTMSFSFQGPDLSAPIDYPAMYVTKEVARVAQELFKQGTNVLELPDEVVAARKVHRPHDNSNMGMIAQAMGVSEFYLECSVCGQRAGSCNDEGDELVNECMGCFRSFSHVLTD